MTRQRHKKSQEALARALADQAPRFAGQTRAAQAKIESDDSMIPKRFFDHQLVRRWVLVRFESKYVMSIAEAAFEAGIEASFPGTIRSENGEPVTRPVITGALFIGLPETKSDNDAMKCFFEWYHKSSVYGRFELGRKLLIVGEKPFMRFRESLGKASAKLGREDLDVPTFTRGEIVRNMDAMGEDLAEWIVESQEADQVKVRAKNALGGILARASTTTIPARYLERQEAAA